MDVGKLRERARILSLAETEKGVFVWQPAASIWVQAQPLDKVNLFSKVGIGARSMRFTLRRRELTLHNAFLWKEKHCFLTDIKEIDRMYIEITAAQVEIIQCAATHAVITKSALKRPVAGEPVITRFPGCLLEKYLGWTQEKPMSQTEQTLVLVTPKEIILTAGDLVETGGEKYIVRIAHTLDLFKNEYEIYIKKDI